MRMRQWPPCRSTRILNSCIRPGSAGPFPRLRLRPGVVDFDGRRIDTITEGMMVEPGQWVRCIEVKAGKVIVRPVEKPNLGDLDIPDFR